MAILYISGKADIICYFYGNFLFFLNYKSPIDRERFKFELTLPLDTYPPAVVILVFSMILSGLWSTDNYLTLSYYVHKIALESPALAT